MQDWMKRLETENRVAVLWKEHERKTQKDAGHERTTKEHMVTAKNHLEMAKLQLLGALITDTPRFGTYNHKNILRLIEDLTEFIKRW